MDANSDDRKVKEMVDAFHPFARLAEGKYPIIDGKIYTRIELGIDGNAGYALIGPDIQAGEAEFVTVEQIGDELLSISERRAAKRALYKLRTRLDMPHLSYYLDDSYPGAG